MVVTMDDGRRELPNAGLFVRDGIIEQVAPTEELPRDADVVLDLTGQILLPGFVNTHHHLTGPSAPSGTIGASCLGAPPASLAGTPYRASSSAARSGVGTRRTRAATPRSAS